MVLPADIDMVFLVAKVLAVAGLVVAGIVLLLQAYIARRPAKTVGRQTVRRSRARRAPDVVLAAAPRLGPGTELQRLASVMDGARVRLETITTSQRAAARHLDSAEIALNRLLSEIVGVMPAAISPTIVPRRSALVGLPSRSALAA